MSEKNRQGKLSARERIAADRRQEESRAKRRKTLVVAASIVAVLGVAGAIGAVAANMGGDSADAAGPVVAPKGAAGEDSLAVPVGKDSAKSTLTVWEDFRCPACSQFENAYRSTIHELTGKGQLRVEYHLATLIDKNMGGSGSARAANAALCAQDAGKFAPYHDLLYRNQPPETEDAYAKPAKLLELAGKVDGLDTPAFRDCVSEGTHDAWVTKSDEKFQQGGFRGTPTVQLNGKDVFADQKNPLTPAKLKKMTEEAAKG